MSVRRKVKFLLILAAVILLSRSFRLWIVGCLLMLPWLPCVCSCRLAVFFVIIGVLLDLIGQAPPCPILIPKICML